MPAAVSNEFRRVSLSILFESSPGTLERYLAYLFEKNKGYVQRNGTSINLYLECLDDKVLEAIEAINSLELHLRMQVKVSPRFSTCFYHFKCLPGVGPDETEPPSYQEESTSPSSASADHERPETSTVVNTVRLHTYMQSYVDSGKHLDDLSEYSNQTRAPTWINVKYAGFWKGTDGEPMSVRINLASVDLSWATQREIINWIVTSNFMREREVIDMKDRYIWENLTIAHMIPMLHSESSYILHKLPM